MRISFQRFWKHRGKAVVHHESSPTRYAKVLRKKISGTDFLRHKVPQHVEVLRFRRSVYLKEVLWFELGFSRLLSKELLFWRSSWFWWLPPQNAYAHFGFILKFRAQRKTFPFGRRTRQVPTIRHKKRPSPCNHHATNYVAYLSSASANRLPDSELIK